MEKKSDNNNEKSELSDEERKPTADFDFKWENKSVLEIAESNYSVRDPQTYENHNKEIVISMESSPESIDLEEK